MRVGKIKRIAQRVLAFLEACAQGGNAAIARAYADRDGRLRFEIDFGLPQKLTAGIGKDIRAGKMEKQAEKLILLRLDGLYRTGSG